MTLSDRSGHFLEKSIFDKEKTISCGSLFSFWPVAVVLLRPILGLTTVPGRSFFGLVEPSPVLAGVPKTSFKKSSLGLNVQLVALAAQVASGQPERVRSTLLQIARHRCHCNACKFSFRTSRHTFKIELHTLKHFLIKYDTFASIWQLFEKYYFCRKVDHVFEIFHFSSIQ